MSQDLGDAVLDISVDLAGYDRELDAAERKTAVAAAKMQRLLDLKLDIDMSPLAVAAAEMERRLSGPTVRVGGVVARMERQLDGSIGQMRIMTAEATRLMEHRAATVRMLADAEVAAARKTTAAYAEQAAAARAAGVAEGTRGSTERRSVMYSRDGESTAAPRVYGVRGTNAPGSEGDPMTVVIEAANRVGMGSLAAAVGYDSAGGTQTSTPGGARSAAAMSERDLIRAVGAGEHGAQMQTLRDVLAAVAGRTSKPKESAGDRAALGAALAMGNRVQKTAILRRLSAEGRGHEVPEILAAGRGGEGGGGGYLGLLGGAAAGGGGGESRPWVRNLLWGTGLLGLAGFGSVGSFAGFGAEHLLMTGLGVAGSAAGAAVGGGLLALGAGGQMAVGGGSDLAVMKSTLTDTKSLEEAYDKVSKAVALYGKNSAQAKEAQKELNLLMSELGNTAGVKAEFQLAKAADALNEYWDKATSGARVQAVKVLMQVLQLGKAFIPRVAEAAEQNLQIINQKLKPLMGWLTGAEGMGIWHTLEENFKSSLPTAMDAFGKSVEFVSRLTSIASSYTGGSVTGLDHLATRLNNLSNSQINGFVAKMVGDFRTWRDLIKVLGQDLFYLFKNDVGTGRSIVETLTQMLTRLREWEKSTQGSAQLATIFMVHKEEVLALLHLLDPLAKGFSSIYMAISPTLVNAVTTLVHAFEPFLTILGDVLKHSEGLSLALGAILISVKAMGAKQTWTGLKGLFGWLTGAETANAAAANADAAANARAAASADAAAGASGATAAGGLAGLGARASGAVESGALGLGGVLEGVGLGALGSRVVGAGGVLAPILGGAVPALFAGGAGYLGGNLAANLVGAHGGFKGAIEGLTTGAAIGTTIAPGIGTLAGGAIGELAGGITGLLNQKSTVEIKSLGEWSKASASELTHLIYAMKKAGTVKLDGMAEPLKPMLEKLRQMRNEVEHLEAAFGKASHAVSNFAVGAGTPLHAIQERFTANMKLIAHEVGLSSEQGRQLAEQNVSMMMSRIIGEIAAGRIPVAQGMKLVAQDIGRETKATGTEVSGVYARLFAQIAAEEKIGAVNAKQAWGMYRSIATEETNQLKQQVTSRYHQMMSHLEGEYHRGELTTRQYNERVQHLAHDTTAVVGPAMANLAASITNAIANGTLGAAEGIKILHKDFNQLIKQFGGKPMSMGQVSVYVAGKAAGNMGAAALEGVAGLAGGGVMQIGNPGEAGHDSVPLNVGGMPVMVAPGEQVVVFNRHQIPEVNARFSDYGGLPGFFAANTRPNYMASGGMLPNPKVRGGGSLGAAIQAAFNMAVKTGDAYLHKHERSTGAGVSTAGLSGSLISIVHQIARRLGWSGQVGDWLDVINAESGGSMTARNPSSGAYGIAQFIEGPAGYAKYGGNVNTLAGQLAAMANYMKCVPLDTEILTREGWKGHDKVAAGDETLGFDPVSRKARWTKITEVHHHRDAPVVELANRRWKSRSTANHRWLADKAIQRRSGTSRRDEFVRTDAIGTRHRLRLAAPAETKSSLPITEHESELLGWLLGDGHVRQRGKCREAWVDQIKPKWMADLRALMAHFPHKESVTEREGGTKLHRFRLSAPFVRDLMERSRYDDGWETIVLAMSHEQRRAFLRGIERADGYHAEACAPVIAQNEGEGLESIKLAAFLCGHYCNPTSSGGQTHITVGKPTVKGGAFERTDIGRQDVWCVTTDLGSWTMRQGGRIMLTGNSRYGDPAAAWAHETAYKWYARGGVVGFARGGMPRHPHHASKRPPAPPAGLPQRARRLNINAMHFDPFRLVPSLAQMPARFQSNLSLLGSIIGPSGSVAAAQERFSFLQPSQELALSQQPYGGAFIVSEGEGGERVAPFEYMPNVEMHTAQLQQLLEIQSRVKGELEHALQLVDPLSKTVEEAVEYRSKQIEKIKQRIKHLREQLARRLKKLREKIKANLKQIKHYEHEIKVLKEGKLPSHPTARKNAEESREHSVGALEGSIKRLEAQNEVIGGSSTYVGEGGRIGALRQATEGEVKHLQGNEAKMVAQRTKLGEYVTTTPPWTLGGKQVSGLLPEDRTSIIGVSGVGGKLAETNAVVGQLEKQMGEMGAARLAKQLAAAKVNAGGGESASQSELNSLLKQQLEETQKALYVSQQQYKVLANFSMPPFAGKFHTGGIIPGPVGADRMALVQAGERITQIGKGEQPVRVQVIVEDGAVDARRIRVISGDEAERRIRRPATAASRPLPSVGGGWS